jgi:hypothetical protein
VDSGSVDELLETIRQAAQIPFIDASQSSVPNQEVMTDEGLLRLATKEIRLFVQPRLMALREDYFKTHQDFTITEQGASYRIPAAAIGNKLANVTYVDSSGLETPVNSLGGDASLAETADGFVIKGGSVILKKNVTSGTLRMEYYFRSPALVLLEDAGEVSEFDGDFEFTLSANVPSTIEVGTVVDIVSGVSPFTVLQTGLVVDNVGLDYFSVSVSPSVTVAEGDFVVVSGQTCVVPLSLELHPILAQRVAVKVLKSIGDSEGAATAEGDLQIMEQAIPILASPRVDDRPKKIVNNALLGNGRGSW